MPKGGVQDRKQLFCDYCKLVGDTIQKCYKLPPGHKFHKGRKVAAVVQSHDIDSLGCVSGHNYDTYTIQGNLAANPAFHSLTLEQYNQLLQLLSQQTSEHQLPRNDSTAAAGFLAGKNFCFLTTIGNNNWILDSRASDHITHDLSLLHYVKPLQQTCYLLCLMERRLKFYMLVHCSWEMVWF